MKFSYFNRDLLYKLLLLVILLSSNCGKDFVLTGRTLNLIGEVLLDKTTVKKNQIINSNQTILVNNESICDIQLEFPEVVTPSVVMVYQNSEFSFKETKPKKDKSISFYLNKGSANFRIQPQDKKSLFSVITPVLVITAQNADFSITISEEGEKIQSIRGTIKYKSKFPKEYEEAIPAEVFQASKDLSSLQEQMDLEEKSIEGDEVFISYKTSHERLEKAGVLDVLKEAKQNPQLKPTQGSVSKEELQKFTKAIEVIYEKKPEARNYIQNSFKKELPFKVEKIGYKELKRKLEEANSLTYIDPKTIRESKNIIEVIDKRNEKIKADIYTAIEKSKNGKKGKITFNGEPIECVIYTVPQYPDHYVCETISGIKKFHKSEVTLSW